MYTTFRFLMMNQRLVEYVRRDSEIVGEINERWIFCDTCEVWFHMVCVKLNRAPRGHWSCSACSYKK